MRNARAFGSKPDAPHRLEGAAVVVAPLPTVEPAVAAKLAFVEAFRHKRSIAPGGQLQTKAPACLPGLLHSSRDADSTQRLHECRVPRLY
jgi:hypothetical protein